jgi:hypothetical protein
MKLAIHLHIDDVDLAFETIDALNEDPILRTRLESVLSTTISATLLKRVEITLVPTKPGYYNPDDSAETLAPWYAEELPTLKLTR